MDGIDGMKYKMKFISRVSTEYFIDLDDVIVQWQWPYIDRKYNAWGLDSVVGFATVLLILTRANSFLEGELRNWKGSAVNSSDAALWTSA